MKSDLSTEATLEMFSKVFCDASPVSSVVF